MNMYSENEPIKVAEIKSLKRVGFSGMVKEVFYFTLAGGEEEFIATPTLHATGTYDVPRFIAHGGFNTTCRLCGSTKTSLHDSQEACSFFEKEGVREEITRQLVMHPRFRLRRLFNQSL